MARRSLPRPKPPLIRSVLVELPEDKLRAVSVRAGALGVSVHSLLAGVVLDWLESA